MSEIPNKLLSFEDWAASFKVPDPDERVSLERAAGRLLKDPVFLRVLAELERNHLEAFRRCPLGADDRLLEIHSAIHGIGLVRQGIAQIVSNARFERKVSQDKDAVL